MPNIDQLKIKGELFEDHGTFVMFEIKDKAYLNEILSNVLTFNINPDKISFIEISNDGLCPHTDGYVGCRLNYVLEDSESITVFWKLAKKSFSPELAKKLKDGSYKPTETKGHNYSDLDYVCSFKSTQGDAHLIDVRNIHSVEKYKCTVKRKLLSFRWDPKYNLEEIYNLQKENTFMDTTDTKLMNIYSDATMNVLTSSQNTNFIIKYKDIFPVGLSDLEFDATDQDVQYFTAEATFKYTIYDITDLNGDSL